MTETTAWLIERHIDSRLHYWTGRLAKEQMCWSSKVTDAVRFARRTDAESILSWHLEGVGNVVEHGWSDMPGRDPEGA